MNLLKRELAPLTEEAWGEIDHTAREVLHSHLSARKFVDVKGPFGWGFSGVNKGQVKVPESPKQPQNQVEVGIRQIQPLIEARKHFTLDIWELDNLSRGAKDVNTDPLEKAVADLAQFEESVIYQGYAPAGIEGLEQKVAHSIHFGKVPADLADATTQAVTTLLDHSVEGPFALVVNTQLWRQLFNHIADYPLRKQIPMIINGPIILSQAVSSALLISLRGGDLELTLGNDFSIGFQSASAQEVNLYIHESFTFEILEPNALVMLIQKSG